MKRAPAVAGQFYYGTPERLRKQVEGLIDRHARKERAIGILSPHAGFMYSGKVAGAVYSSIEFPETFVLIGPNHTGLGEAVSVMPEGIWEIPTGSLHIDDALAGEILKNVPSARADSNAHMLEHSLEVQLPFISYFSDTARIVPIAVMSGDAETLKTLGLGISKAAGQTGRKVVIAASSDMSHYVSEETARMKDGLAIDRILALDPEGLYNTVRKEGISMCGCLPSVAMLHAAKALGAKEAFLVKYATSGEFSGDFNRVVGYAGIVIK